MDEQQLATIEARHCPGTVYGQATAGGPVRFCEYCSHADDHDCHDEPWPCDAAALVAEVRRLQQENVNLAAHVEALMRTGEALCTAVNRPRMGGEVPPGFCVDEMNRVHRASAIARGY